MVKRQRKLEAVGKGKVADWLEKVKHLDTSVSKHVKRNEAGQGSNKVLENGNGFSGSMLQGTSQAEREVGGSFGSVAGSLYRI